MDTRCRRWGFPERADSWLRGALVVGAFLAAPIAVAEQFDDVPPGHWAAAAVAIVTGAGVMDGCGGDFFCLDEPITREDMAVWLERGLRGAEFVPPPASGEFTDVDPSYCLAPWIEQLYDDDMTAGCSASPLKYCPYSLLSRAEMAVFLVGVRHGVDFRPPPCSGIFTDVPCPGYWATDWIEQLFRDEITGGCVVTPLQFCPFNQVTRAQMAVFLVAGFNLT